MTRIQYSEKWPNRDARREEWIPRNLCVNGYNYSFKCYGSKKFCRIIYRCVHGSPKSKNPCYAILKVDLYNNNIYYYLTKKHTCDIVQNIPIPYYSDLQIKTKICELYNDTNNMHLPDLIFNALLNWINTTTPSDATKNIVTQSSVRKYVHYLINIEPRNNFSYDNCITKDNKPFLLFTIRIDDKPIYGFASEHMISCVNDCSIIGIDGTFHSSPQNYYQNCIFMGRTSVMNLPLLYLILPDKKQTTYMIAFKYYMIALDSHGIKLKNNVKFICDFEKAEINAIKDVFISENRSIQLCYFHYTQLLHKHYVIIQNKHECKFTNYLYNILRKLPFCNIHEVNIFIKFIKNAIYVTKKAKLLINYFVRTFVQIFDINDWNVSGKILEDRATNNFNESFNKKINERLPKSPTIQNLFAEFVILENKYKNKYINYKLNESNVDKDFYKKIIHNEKKIINICMNKLFKQYPKFKEEYNQKGLINFCIFESDNFKIKIPIIP